MIALSALYKRVDPANVFGTGSRIDFSGLKGGNRRRGAIDNVLILTGSVDHIHQSYKSSKIIVGTYAIVQGSVGA